MRSSAKQTIHMKRQAIPSLKVKKKSIYIQRICQSVVCCSGVKHLTHLNLAFYQGDFRNQCRPDHNVYIKYRNFYTFGIYGFKGQQTL